MSDKVALTVQKRDVEHKAKVVRREGLIPGIVYGHGRENVPVEMDYQTFRKTFDKATYSTLVDLTVEGGETFPVLIHEVQYEPVKDLIQHVDFHAIRMDQKIHTHIALKFVGDSEAERLGAVLITNRHDMNVSCLPTDLVHEIEVDISALKEFGDSLHVRDIVVPPGIELEEEEDASIIQAVAPKTQEQIDAEEAAEIAADEAAAAEAAGEGEEGGAGEGGEEAVEEGEEKKEE
jgi:large subunit ribosomal protein L25